MTFLDICSKIHFHSLTATSKCGNCQTGQYNVVFCCIKLFQVTMMRLCVCVCTSVYVCVHAHACAHSYIHVYIPASFFYLLVALPFLNSLISLRIHLQLPPFVKLHTSFKTTPFICLNAGTSFKD